MNRSELIIAPTKTVDNHDICDVTTDVINYLNHLFVKKIRRRKYVSNQYEKSMDTLAFSYSGEYVQTKNKTSFRGNRYSSFCEYEFRISRICLLLMSQSFRLLNADIQSTRGYDKQRNSHLCQSKCDSELSHHFCEPPK
ncbi:Hypothetical predicted protein [Octopus vulgaris]|uniref:Uncharacterized protein n=1 Tax=Octopus vulgaris TaxID=6645 RepID=A0AA36BBB7_OCTVU|nr:Hypothetical predicted protein [Octopus vulgaris]